MPNGIIHRLRAARHAPTSAVSAAWTATRWSRHCVRTGLRGPPRWRPRPAWFSYHHLQYFGLPRSAVSRLVIQRTLQGIQTGQLPRKLITCERAVGARDRFAVIQRKSEQRDRRALLLTVFVYPPRSRLTICGASGSGREKVGDNPSSVCAQRWVFGLSMSDRMPETGRAGSPQVSSAL